MSEEKKLSTLGPELVDYEETAEWAKDLESLKPDIFSIVEIVRSRVKPRTFHQEAGSQFVKMDVGMGPEEVFWPVPESDIGQYDLKIENNQEMEELLRELGVVSSGFRVKESKLFLKLEKKGGGDFEKDAIGDLVIGITSESKEIRSLEFSSGFFLKDGEIFGNLNALGFRHRKHRGLLRRKMPPELIERRPSIQFFKKVRTFLEKM